MRKVQRDNYRGGKYFSYSEFRNCRHARQNISSEARNCEIYNRTLSIFSVTYFNALMTIYKYPVKRSLCAVKLQLCTITANRKMRTTYVVTFGRQEVETQRRYE